mgnify:CR=1 FL=1
MFIIFQGSGICCALHRSGKFVETTFDEFFEPIKASCISHSPDPHSFNAIPPSVFFLASLYILTKTKRNPASVENALECNCTFSKQTKTPPHNWKISPLNEKPSINKQGRRAMEINGVNEPDENQFRPFTGLTFYLFPRLNIGRPNRLQFTMLTFCICDPQYPEDMQRWKPVTAATDPDCATF